MIHGSAILAHPLWARRRFTDFRLSEVRAAAHFRYERARVAAYVFAGELAAHDASVVLLLHGWPDDSSTWNAIIPTLNDAGLRTIPGTDPGQCYRAS